MKKENVDLLVIGGGPGGCAAAFYAAERGMKVTLVEQDPNLGGVCLHRGCIPSKALLQTTQAIADSQDLKQRGVVFDDPRINLSKLRDWKDSVIQKMATGLESIAEKRNVSVIQGRAFIESSETVRVETADTQLYLSFERCILATGSRAALPSLFDLGNPRIFTSSQALQIEDVPKNLLIVGAGYIGMELGTVYARLGSDVTVVETLDRPLSVADADLVKPLAKKAGTLFRDLLFQTEVTDVETVGNQIAVTTKNKDDEESVTHYDSVLVSVGRQPNIDNLGLENISIELSEKGEIKVDDQQVTKDPRFLAIGDVTGGMYLAHEAAREGRVAVETLLGDLSSTAGRVIPAVVFTDPEIAWCGLTETEAKQSKRTIKTALFPWSASGRALTQGRSDGLTKLVVDPNSERVLGVGICGHGAAELIAEGALAIEMAATTRDLAEITHPHPTLSETIMEAAEVFYGTSTHHKR